MLQAGRSLFQFPMKPLDFSIDLILPATLWPRVDSASNRNGKKAAGAKADITVLSQLPRKCGSLDASHTFGPPRTVTGMVLPF
jgi:hypothetical protein